MFSGTLLPALRAMVHFQDQAAEAFSLDSRWDNFEDRGTHKFRTNRPYPKWNTPSAIPSHELEAGEKQVSLGDE